MDKQGFVPWHPNGAPFELTVAGVGFGLNPKTIPSVIQSHPILCENGKTRRGSAQRIVPADKVLHAELVPYKPRFFRHQTGSFLTLQIAWHWPFAPQNLPVIGFLHNAGHTCFSTMGQS